MNGKNLTPNLCSCRFVHVCAPWSRFSLYVLKWNARMFYMCLKQIVNNCTYVFNIFCRLDYNPRGKYLVRLALTTKFLLFSIIGLKLVRNQQPLTLHGQSITNFPDFHELENSDRNVIVFICIASSLMDSQYFL